MLTTYLVNETMCVTKYVEVCVPRYEPCEDRELFEDMGYRLISASECFSDSLYTFQYMYDDESFTEIKAKSRQEAIDLYWERNDEPHTPKFRIVA